MSADTGSEDVSQQEGDTAEPTSDEPAVGRGSRRTTRVAELPGMLYLLATLIKAKHRS